MRSRVSVFSKKWFKMQRAQIQRLAGHPERGFPEYECDGEPVDFDQTAPLVYDELPVKRGELRLGLFGYILQAVRDIDNEDPLAVAVPHEADYTVFQKGDVIPESQAPEYWLEEYQIEADNGSVWEVTKNTPAETNFPSVAKSIDTAPVVVKFDVRTWGGKTNFPVAKGSLYTYHGGLYMMSQDTNWAASDVLPLKGEEKATFLRWMIADSSDLMTRASDFNTEVAHPGDVYFSPDQLGTTYGTVYRWFLDPIDTEFLTLFDNWENVKIVNASFRTEVWLDGSRSNGAPNFIEHTAGNNWPNDERYRVRTIEKPDGEVAIQQGDNVRIVSGWVDFVGDNPVFNDLGRVMQNPTPSAG